MMMMMIAINHTNFRHPSGAILARMKVEIFSAHVQRKDSKHDYFLLGSTDACGNSIMANWAWLT
jgi:hypothetical protein